MRKLMIGSFLFFTLTSFSTLKFQESNIFDKVTEQCVTGSDIGLKNQIAARFVGLFIAASALILINDLYYLLNVDSIVMQKEQERYLIKALNFANIISSCGLGYMAHSLVSYRLRPENVAGRVSIKDRELLNLIFLNEDFIESDKLKKIYQYRSDYLKQAWFGCKRIKRHLELIISSLRSIPQYQHKDFDSLKNDVESVLDGVEIALNKINQKLLLYGN